MGLAHAAAPPSSSAPVGTVQVELTFDGGVHPGAGPKPLHHGRFAFHAVGDTRLLQTGYEVYRHVTSNRAEYLALKGALRALMVAARDAGIDPRTIDLRLFTDSQLVARQLQAEWAVDDPTLRTLNLRVGAQLQQFGAWHIAWTPRLTINTRLAEALPARKARRTAHASKPLLKPDGTPDQRPRDAAQRRAAAHDARRFKPAARSALAADERVALQARLEREKLDAAAAKRSCTRAAQKLGAAPAEVACATAQADDYLARVPNTQFSRDDLILRYVQIERKRAELRNSAATTPSEEPSTSLPHPDLAHQPAYLAIVREVDAYLAGARSNLSRTALIEHQWTLHCQREALRQQQPWRTLRKVDGSVAFSPTSSHKPLVAQEQLLHPGPSVRCFPDMAMAALRDNRACEFRVWEIARHLDAAGSGEVRYAHLRDFVCETHDVFTVRRFQQLVRQGQGAFWVKHWRMVPDPATGRLRREAWLRLIGQAEVAQLFAIPPLRIHCVRVRLSDLLQGMGRANAALFTAFHAGRGEREKHNGPISRATLRDLSGKSGSAQRTYDRAMGTVARPNYVRTGIAASTAGANELAHAALRHEGAAFVVNDSVFRRKPQANRLSQTSHPFFGCGAIAVRLPNSYRTNSTHFERACAGRKRRVNQALHQHRLIQHTHSANHLVGLGGRGINWAGLQRRYFETRPQAQKAWDRRYKLALQHEAQAQWAHPDAARELRRVAEMLRQPAYALRVLKGEGNEHPIGWSQMGRGFAELGDF